MGNELLIPCSVVFEVIPEEPGLTTTNKSLGVKLVTLGNCDIFKFAILLKLRGYFIIVIFYAKFIQSKLSPASVKIRSVPTTSKLKTVALS